MPLTQVPNEMLNNVAPPGVVLPYAGTSAPTVWLLCYGQAISRTTYAALFAAISTAYGVVALDMVSLQRLTREITQEATKRTITRSLPLSPTTL